MSIFKSKYNFPDDSIIVKVTLDKDYEPAKNPAVKEVIESIDSTKGLDIPKIGETYPRLNLLQAQTFFLSLKQLFPVGRNIEVKVEKLEFLQRDEKKKWESYLNISDFEITIDYLNLTVPVVKNFFTAERFEQVSYEDKQDAAEEFLDEYAKQTKCPASDLAVIPTQEQVDHDEFERINPLVNQRIKDEAKQKQAQSQAAEARRKAASQAEEQRKKAKVANSNSSQGFNPNQGTEPQARTVSQQTWGSRTRLTAGQNANNNNDGVQIVNDGHVFAPQFEIKEYPESAADPSSPDYVAFMLNEKKKESNEYLRKVAEICNLSTDKELSKQVTVGRNSIEKKIGKYQEDNINKTVVDSIKSDINERLNNEKDREWSNKANELEEIKKKAILEAKKMYEESKLAAENKAKEATAKLEDELAKKYADQGNVEVEQKVKELHEKTESQINKMISTEVRTLNSNLNGSALTIQEANSKKLNESYKKFSTLFAEYTDTFEQQHSNAVRKQADLNSSQYKLDEAKNNQTKLVDYKNQFEKEHEDNLANQRQVNELQEKLNKVVGELKDKELMLSQKSEKKDDLTELAKIMALVNGSQTQPTNHLAEPEKKHTGIKWLVGSLVVLIVGSGSAFGTLAYQQNSQRMDRLTKANEQVTQKLADTNKKVSAKDKLKEKNDELQKQIEQQNKTNKLLTDSITKDQSQNQVNN